MSRIAEPTPAQDREWKKWVSTRPATIRAVAEKFEPWSLYRMKSTGDRVTLFSFAEEKNGKVTLTVEIRAAFNVVLFERRVFGVDPDDLEPCDPPGPEEATGALMTDQQVEEHIDALRVAARPDLWVMGEDGVARRKQ